MKEIRRWVGDKWVVWKVLQRYFLEDTKGRIERRGFIRRNSDLEGWKYGVWVFVDEEFEGRKVDRGMRKKAKHEIKKVIVEDLKEWGEEVELIMNAVRVVSSLDMVERKQQEDPKRQIVKLQAFKPNEPLIINVDFLESFFSREKNEPLYKLYRILSSNTPKKNSKRKGKEVKEEVKEPQTNYGATGITYSRISKLFESKSDKNFKMDQQIVSHY